MKVEERKIDQLIPYAKNARKLTDANIDGIAASIKQFGYDTPILVDSENVIIAGHGRYAALKKLGHKTVKVVVSDISKKDAAARRLLDNRQVEVREYDPELVRLEIEEFELDFEPFGIDFDRLLGEDIIPSASDSLSLPDGDRPGLQQKTFTLSNDQIESVDRAIAVAKEMGDFGETGNENGNGNALARICEIFVTEHGQS